MKALPFALAIFCGKLVQFLTVSLITIWFGPTLIHSLRQATREHMNLLIGTALLGLLLLAFWVVRKIFDRKRGVPLPVEEEPASEVPARL